MLDGVVRQMAHNPLFKGIFVAMVLVALWVGGSGDRNVRQAGLLATIFISVVAIGVGRSLANLLPFSSRPIHTTGLTFNMPIGGKSETLDGWSSMPSDHAVLFFAIAVSVVFVSRWVGLFLVTHAALIISLPRVFLGLHWPSDILVGALVGSLIAIVLFRPLQRALLVTQVPTLFERFGIVTYPLLFLSFLQIGTNFESLRQLASSLGKVIDMAQR